MCAPSEDDDPPPIPISSIVVSRMTKLSFENVDQATIHDVWSGKESDVCALTSVWIRETTFDKLLIAPPGYKVVRVTQDSWSNASHDTLSLRGSPKTSSDTPTLHHRRGEDCRRRPGGTGRIIVDCGKRCSRIYCMRQRCADTACRIHSRHRREILSDGQGRVKNDSTAGCATPVRRHR